MGMQVSINVHVKYIKRGRSSFFLGADFQHRVNVFSLFVYTKFRLIMHGLRAHTYSNDKTFNSRLSQAKMGDGTLHPWNIKIHFFVILENVS